MFLAIDQLINSSLNCIDDIKLSGKFKIICLISDLPKEGTQAFSNNISLFSNLSPLIEVNCFSSNVLKNCLNNSNSNISIFYLQNIHTVPYWKIMKIIYLKINF